MTIQHLEHHIHASDQAERRRNAEVKDVLGFTPKLPSKQATQEAVDASPDVYGSSLAYSAHHHKVAKKMRGPAAMTAANRSRTAGK